MHFISRSNLVLTLLVVAGCFSASSLRAAETGEEDVTKTPEYKVLDRYTGSWDEVHTVKVPEDRSAKGTAVISWILKSRYQEFRCTSELDHTESRHLRTYDPQQRAYRHFWFSSNGQSGEVKGTWNEATPAMTTAMSAAERIILSTRTPTRRS